MKRSIGRKLTTSGLVVLLFIILIFAASQVAVGLFKDTSKNLIVEYHELDALQELKLSLSAMLTSSAYYDGHREEQYRSQFCDEILNVKASLMVCRAILTSRHDKEHISELEAIVSRLDEITLLIQQNPDKEEGIIQSLLEKGNAEIQKGYGIIDLLLDQTKLEIIDYESKNNTVIRHSTFTFLTLGLLVIAILIYRGFIVIRSVTKPIKQLVSVTEDIGKGNRKARANIDSKDEFATLAQSLNDMVNALENTTVSRNYLNNILENMFDALIVTDNELKVRSANKATLKLCGYTDEDIKGLQINNLFDLGKKYSNTKPPTEKELNKLRKIINENKHILTADGKRIPVSLSSSVLKDQKEGTEGLIIVVYDRSEQEAVEDKLENVRKDRLIAINEAQEEERMRIATDLHDGLGQILTSISYAIQELSDEANRTNEENNEILANVQRQIDSAIREAKNISHDLIPIVLKDFGLIVAIENLIGKANEIHETNFQFNAFDFDERIDPKMEKALFRICQESMNNIIKHAKAKNAMFQILRQNQAIVMVIEDDGQGFNKETDENGSSGQGIGLISIKERVAAFNGTFTINSSPDFGTEIIVEIPCRRR